ncbi:MAG: NifB/NifX family molybdenum-iron cluster-binding protein [Gemmatimonadota bacterium]
MNICIPTVDNSGLKARLFPHFGSAPFFTIVRAETLEARSLANEHARHEHGACRPMAALAGLDVDVVLCRGLGARALERLRSGGISVMVADAWHVDEALRALRKGRARPLFTVDACQGGPHEH